MTVRSTAQEWILAAGNAAQCAQGLAKQRDEFAEENLSSKDAPSASERPQSDGIMLQRICALLCVTLAGNMVLC